MTLKTLRKELERLQDAEERLLDFLIHNPEHQQDAVNKILEVASLILKMKNIILEMEKNSKTGD